VHFRYKPENELGITANEDYVGFSAQAVQQVIPEAVTRDEQGYLLVHNDAILWTTRGHRIPDGLRRRARRP
jgi:hypothetical protein